MENSRISPTSPSLFLDINKKFKNYKIKHIDDNIETYCFPKKYKLQPHQILPPLLISPNTDIKGILLYYGIGSGKTCASIQIAEKWIDNGYKIIVVVPASLKDNYLGEIMSQCTGSTYISDIDRGKMTEDIINKTIEKIKKNYLILSYNKFVEYIKNDNITLTNTLLIMDEIQNAVSEKGTYYKTIYEFIKKSSKTCRIVLMTATPIFDKPLEFALTMNLLPLPELMPVGKKFYSMFLDDELKVINKDKFKKYIRGFVSYYKGAPEKTYPEKRIHYIKCEMEKFQLSTYMEVKKIADKYNISPQKKNIFFNDIAHLSSTFFLGLRIVSNIAFPNKNTGKIGLDSLTNNYMEMNNLKNYSIKFYEILKNLKKCERTAFIYSGFKTYGGLETFAKILEFHGYKNYEQHGPGKKRYAVWSGDETLQYRNSFKKIFNSDENFYGEKIKLVLGSPAIKEGVSFYRVEQVHILDIYWNISRMEQVIGRAVRFCSHKDLPKNKQFVDIYIYLAVHNSIKQTIDEKILEMSNIKQKLNEQFELLIKESAIDCELNKVANTTNKSKIICDK